MWDYIKMDHIKCNVKVLQYGTINKYTVYHIYEFSNDLPVARYYVDNGRVIRCGDTKHSIKKE